jgi:hypothetical protein
MITGYFVYSARVYFDQCKTKQNKIHAVRPPLQKFPLLSVTELLYNLTINSPPWPTHILYRAKHTKITKHVERPVATSAMMSEAKMPQRERRNSGLVCYMNVMRNPGIRVWGGWG